MEEAIPAARSAAAAISFVLISCFVVTVCGDTIPEAQDGVNDFLIIFEHSFRKIKNP